jgi:hypothetical protein
VAAKTAVSAGGLVLADHGHGREWRDVFAIGAEDESELHDVLVSVASAEPIETVRATSEGTNCVLRAIVELHGRRAPVVTAWNLGAGRDPHLVTAYPAP